MKRLTAISLLIALALIAPGFSAAAQGTDEDCELVNNMERLDVYFAPMTDSTQLMTILPEGVEYTMIGRAGSNFLVRLENGETGWLDWHQRVSNSMCISAPYVELPLVDYPTVCSIVVDQDAPMYEDSDLTEPDRVFRGVYADTYPVTAHTDEAAFLFLSDHMGGGWISRDAGRLRGHCEGTVQLVTTTQETRLWHLPSVRDNRILTTLPAGTTLGIAEGPVNAPIRTDSDVMGDWYRVKSFEILGWAWVGNLRFGRTFSAPLDALGQAEVLEGANLWTEPDATSGDLVTTLFGGSTINITGDPVTGPIRADGSADGQWYPVQQGGTAGWVWAGRLSMVEEK